LLEVEQVVEERYHFLVKDHRLTFHGICQECYEKEKKGSLSIRTDELCKIKSESE
ncbi:transcriptional repressor, partial [Enterococcus faecium]